MIEFLKSILRGIRGPENSHKGEYRRVYLALQSNSSPERYEIYVDGKKSGHMVTQYEIKFMLDKNQFKRFTDGETVFCVRHEKIFAKAPLTGKKQRLEDFEPPDFPEYILSIYCQALHF